MEEKKKVLFVDDDELILEMYGVKFSQSNFEVRFAKDAEQAKNVLREGFKPDLIVVDIIMPGKSGLDFIQEAKEEGLLSDAKLVVLSNQGEKEDLTRAKELGVDKYIIKANYIPSEVVAILNNLLAKK